MEVIHQYVDQTQEAHKITNRKTLYAAGAGLIPFPLVDTAALLGIQLTMIRSIAQLYNIEFKKHLAKSLIGSLIGSVATVSLVKLIPGIGTISGSATTSLTGAAATYALGRVFTQHFDQGGTLLDFDPVKSRKHFQEAYDAGGHFVAEQDIIVSSNGTTAATGFVAAETPAVAAATSEKVLLIEEMEQLQLAIQELQSTVNGLQANSNPIASENTTDLAASMEKEQQIKETSGNSSAKKTTKKTRASADLSSNEIVELTIIEGIGAKIATVLKSVGINSCQDLAAIELTKLRQILKEAEGNFNLVDPTSWTLQATLAASGKMDELKKLQNELIGGRYKGKNK